MGGTVLAAVAALGLGGISAPGPAIVQLNNDGPSFTALPGQVNQVTVSRMRQPDGTTVVYRLHDDGAIVIARSPCLQVDAHTATCSYITDPSCCGGAVEINTGDRADTVQMALGGGRATVDLGTGDDALTTGGAREGNFGLSVTAGTGNDTIDATATRDWTVGSIDGGAGDDHISAGRGFQDVYGRDGADVIDGGTFIWGGAGDDVLTGALSELVVGDDGDDRIAVGQFVSWEGGPGADNVDEANGGPNHASGEGIPTHISSCGDGPDVVSADPLDEVPQDCETVNRVG